MLSQRRRWWTTLKQHRVKAPCLVGGQMYDVGYSVKTAIIASWRNLINPNGPRNHIKLRQNKFKHGIKYKYNISRKKH